MKIEFLINDWGKLYDFKTSEEEEEIEEFRIPSIVNGVKVESIGDLRDTFRILYGHGVKKIGHLIIENGVEKIEAFAFSNIDIEIDTVVWPKTCKVIPQYCFAVSTIKAIVGVENVEKIGGSAFRWTLFKSFNWPAKCKVIPEECFYGCTELTTIEGIEQVYRIEACAFDDTQLKRFSWPEGVSATEIFPFLDGCDNLEEIKFEGTGIKDVDLEYFFSLKNIKKIDLSGFAAVNLLNCSSPKGHEVRDKVVLPYYVTEIN